MEYCRLGFGAKDTPWPNMPSKAPESDTTTGSGFDSDVILTVLSVLVAVSRPRVGREATKGRPFGAVGAAYGAVGVSVSG